MAETESAATCSRRGDVTLMAVRGPLASLQWGLGFGGFRGYCCLCRLLRCEQAVLEAGGCVVRLAGLYHAQVRPHATAAPLSSVPPVSASAQVDSALCRDRGCVRGDAHAAWMPGPSSKPYCERQTLN